MLQRLRDRFGTAGLVVAIVALVAALAGTAIAAGGLTAKQKKEVKKIAKGFQGTGPAGPAGPQGPAGPGGKDGAAGAAGANGKDGTSVTSEQFSGTKEGHCSGAGGSRFVSASGATFACNGKEGEPGEDGDPWTVGNVLPSNATETGAWVLPFVAETGVPIGAETFDLPLSFPVKLASELDAAHVHVISEGGKEYVFEGGEGKEVTPSNCEGSAAAPTAAPGHLCVYIGFAGEGVTPGAAISETLKFVQPIRKLSAIEAGASTAGAQLRLHVKAGATAYGSFAVTAP
jgi:hypothetical protein